MKKCPNCSYKTEKEISYCPECGSPIIASPEVKPDHSDRINKETRIPHRLMKWISNRWIVVIVSCIAVLGLGGWISYKVYLNNNPKIVYLLAESATLASEHEQASQFFESDLAFWNAIFTDTSTLTANVQSKFDVDLGIDNDWINFMDSLDLLENISFSMQAGRDKKEDWSEMKIELLDGRKPLVDMIVQQDQEGIYLASDTLMDHPLYWTKNEWLGVEGRAAGEVEIDLEGFKLSKKEKKTLQKWLKHFLYSELNNQVVNIEKNVNYASPDGNVELDKITLTLDEFTVKQIFVRLVDDLRTNDELLDMIVNRAELIYDLTKSRLSEDGEESSIATIGYPSLIHPLSILQVFALNTMYNDYESQEEYIHMFANEDGSFHREVFLERLQDTLTQLRFYFLNEFNGELYMEVVVNKKNVIIDRYVDLTISNDEDQLQIEWVQSYWKDKNATSHTNFELTFNIREYGELNTIKVYKEQKFGKEGKEGVIEGELGLSGSQDRSPLFHISADYLIHEALTNKGTSNYDIELTIMSAGERFKLDIQAERDKNVKRNAFEQQINMHTEMTVPVMLNQSISLEMDTTIDLTLEKGQPPVKSNISRRAVKWADMSEEEKEEFNRTVTERMYQQISSGVLDILF